ncbi:MAG: RNA polymerase sigma factor [Phycisphaerae bacterium]
MAASDEELIGKAVQGDRQALSDLLERHGPGVRGGLSRSIPRRWQAVLGADDVMQQAYTDAFVAIGRFEPRGPGTFAAWLSTLAKRNLIDAIRGLEADKRGGDRQQVGPIGNDESFVALYEQVGGTITSPSRQAARKEARSLLEQAIGSLPEDYQTLIRMYDLEGRTVQEVAQALNRSPGAVFMLRTRAHRRLSEIMGTPSRYLTDSP